MPEFLRLHTPEDALEKFIAALPCGKRIDQEILSVADALDRILALPIQARHPLPPFLRSTVDGYALRASDTFGASSSLPAYLRLSGEITMGHEADLIVEPGHAVLIHTGGMVPEGADAVVMVENTQQVGTEEIEVLKPVASGENVLQRGEDVESGETILQPGTRLRPQEVGGLMALGITQVKVVRRPHVGILSTGDEIIPPWEEPKAGQIRDVNSYTLSALVTRAGAVPIRRGIIPDRYEALLQAVREAHAEDDLIVITAGSSVSAHDRTADVIQQLGDPGVLVHGVSIKPGKPTILAVADGIPIVGLPGNPVSALVIAGLFVSPVIRKLLAMRDEPLIPQIPARLTVNIASETGREDYVPVKLIPSKEGWRAEPVFGRSNLIFTLVRADGLLRIPPEATGLPAGEQVLVRLF
jgi:molybdopterin molybdotransferase